MSFMPVIEFFDHIMLQSVLSSGCLSLKNLFVTARRTHPPLPDEIFPLCEYQVYHVSVRHMISG